MTFAIGLRSILRTQCQHVKAFKALMGSCPPNVSLDTYVQYHIHRETMEVDREKVRVGKAMVSETGGVPPPTGSGTGSGTGAGTGSGTGTGTPQSELLMGALYLLSLPIILALGGMYLALTIVATVELFDWMMDTTSALFKWLKRKGE